MTYTPTQVAALHGEATPVPWAPSAQLYDARAAARALACGAGIAAVRSGHITDYDRECVAVYDQVSDAIDARREAILAVTS